MITYTQKEFEEHKNYYRGLLLYKTDSHGSNYYEASCPCDRCMGEGVIYAGRVNGKLVTVTPDNGVCWKCNGSRFMDVKLKIVTDEYGAILAEKQRQKIQQNIEEAQKRMEEARLARRESNLRLGYRPIDFTIDEWVCLPLEKYSYYRIGIETNRAYLLRLLDDIYKDDVQSVDRWVPRSAFHLLVGTQRAKGEQK